MYSHIKKNIFGFVLGFAITVCGTWLIIFFWNHISTWFKSITPQIGFVSDVVAYQAAIIAIAIPLSFQIISQISERYQSRIIIRKIESQWHFIILMGLLFINSLLAVFLKFATKELDKDWHFHLAWTVLTLFVAAIITLGYFFYDFLRYLTNTKFLIDKLFVDLEKPLNIVTRKTLTNKKFQKEQKKFVKSLEGVGDICVFEIKRRNSSEYLTDSLHKIKGYIKVIFQLDNIDNYQLLSILDANSKKYSIFIQATIYQFIRLREVSIEVQNVEMINLTTHNLNWLLGLLSQGEDYYNLVDTLLRAITKSQYTNQPNYQELDYTSYFMWYTNIVFKNKFNIKYLSLYDENFIRFTREIVSSSKTQLFSRLISMLHDGINYNSNIGNTSSNLLDRFHEIYKINRKINKNIRQLILREEQIQTLEQLQECRSLYYETKSTTKLIAKNISQVKLQQYWQMFVQDNLHISIMLFKNRITTKSMISKIFVKLLRIKILVCFTLSIINIYNKFYKELEQKYNEYDQLLDETLSNIELRFKFNHLVDLIFDLGAWCIFKERFDYLYKLWNYRQPKYASAHWIGSVIIPESLTTLFNMYFQTSFAERGLPIYWEDHHGSERYYDIYFLVLLLREFLNQSRQPVKNSLNDKEPINRFRILDSYHLDRIEYVVNSLISLSRELSSIPNLFNELHFDIEQTNDIIEESLIPFLENLKLEADKQIQELVRHQKISNTKVEEFKEDFLKGYYELVSVRNLFEVLKLSDIRLNEYVTSSPDLEKIGFTSTIYDKEMFFEQWYVSYGNSGINFGQSLARKEDSQLLLKIIKASVRKEMTLDEVIDSYNGKCDNLIIININARFELLFNNQKFKLKSDLIKEDTVSELTKLSDFIGLYVYSQDHEISIFNYYPQIDPELNIPKNSLLVIDTSHLGKLVQYAPVEEVTQYQIKDHIAFRIQAFAEDDTLMNEYLYTSLNPDWLAKKGDKTQQENFLQGQVLIEIYERISLEIDPNFVGFLIPDTDSDKLSYL